MNTLELKEHLKLRIDEINDDVILSQINLILENKSETLENYNLDLQKSENDIANGNIFSHNQVLEKIAEWKKR
jgi:predicted transcriptional regulator